MDVIKLAAAALQPIAKNGVPVMQGWYDEELNKTHVTLWLLTDDEPDAADDEPETEACYIQINIWSSRDEVELKKKIKKLMYKAGFNYEDGQDIQEKPGLYNKALRFYIIRESEE